MEVFLTDNTDNTPEENTNIDPPPGLPSQQNNNQDDEPEPFNTPPSSPHLPDVPMPDELHTPNPGFPPHDDHFHTFHSPPRPNDDMQMMRCIHRQMNHLIYHNIHHHHLIILNHHFLEPLAFLLLQIQLLFPIRLYRQTWKTHQ